MRSKQLIGVAAALAVMCVLAGAVYAYDHGRRDKIAKGISVGGVNIGGLTKDQAERRLEARYLAALHEPIVIHHATKTWTLASISHVRSRSCASLPAHPMREVPTATSALAPDFQPGAA